MRINPCLLSLAFAFVFVEAAAKENAEWTRFRGPNGTGHGQAKGLPLQWNDKDYAWKVKLPGVGHASPVLWGDRLFTTCADEGDGSQYILCYDALTGEKVWQKKHLIKLVVV